MIDTTEANRRDGRVGRQNPGDLAGETAATQGEVHCCHTRSGAYSYQFCSFFKSQKYRFVYNPNVQMLTANSNF